jgi:hypothetical protein
MNALGAGLARARQAAVCTPATRGPNPKTPLPVRTVHPQVVGAGARTFLSASRVRSPRADKNVGAPLANPSLRRQRVDALRRAQRRPPPQTGQRRGPTKDVWIRSSL